MFVYEFHIHYVDSYYIYIPKIYLLDLHLYCLQIPIYLYGIYICVCAHTDMHVYMCIPTNDFSSNLLPQGFL